MTPREAADQFIAICKSGFDNHLEWQNWAKKHRKEIDSLPLPLRKQVWLEWDRATAKEFSVRK